MNAIIITMDILTVLVFSLRCLPGVAVRPARPAAAQDEEPVHDDAPPRVAAKNSIDATGDGAPPGARGNRRFAIQRGGVGRHRLERGAPERRPAAGHYGVEGRFMKLLVVDDHPLFREGLRSVLDALGSDV
jgi:hypothetical protein